MPQVSVLVIDNEPLSQGVLVNILASEGWKVKSATTTSEALSALATGEWSLAIANVQVTGLGGPLYTTLRELSKADPPPDDRPGAVRPNCLRALFLIPPKASQDVRVILDHEGLAYSLQPYRLDEFLRRISDLLLETRSISEPIRNEAMTHIFKGPRLKRKKRDAHQMFAPRGDYMMTEEEINEFEHMEEEERKKREKENRESWRLA